MIQKLLSKFMRRRHFWRDVGFDELSELYTSQLLRSLSISIIGIFTPVYLYKIGYSLKDIALFHVFWFLCRPFFDLLAGKLIGIIGPKHAMLFSGILHVGYLGLVISIDSVGWPLWLVGVTGSMAYGLHIMAIMVDFSKIKHSDHGGKELGYLEIVQKVGGVVGPVVGGLLANYADPKYAIALAMLMLIGSVVPLFFTEEPVVTHQKVHYRGLDVRSHLRDYLSVVPYVIEAAISAIIWPLYAAVFLLGNDTYAKLGIITAISAATALFFTRYIGGLIDKRKGGSLLRISVVANAVVHLFRIVARGPLQVLGINLVNEPITAGYRMPYLKGVFDSADSLPGYRIAYIASLSAVDACARLLLWVVIWLLLGGSSDQAVFQVVFAFGALSSLLIMIERFPALHRR